MPTVSDSKRYLNLSQHFRKIDGYGELGKKGELAFLMDFQILCVKDGWEVKYRSLCKSKSRTDPCRSLQLLSWVQRKDKLEVFAYLNLSIKDANPNLVAKSHLELKKVTLDWVYTLIRAPDAKKGWGALFLILLIKILIAWENIGPHT